VPPPTRRRALRILALLQVRDEASLLPGYLDGLAGQVEGVVALDDGSSDGSAELLARNPLVFDLIRRPVDRPRWDEPANRRELVAAALRHGADWLLALDADERVELDFRRRAERAIGWAELLGFSALSLPRRDLWEHPGTYRADGVWGKRRQAKLFRADPELRFSDRVLHGGWAPVGRRRAHADLLVYHLAFLTPESRAAHRRRYEELDPDGRWQPEGYAYLTDETGLRLRQVPARRGFASA
jgi:glycosyltransferase involved in cell wall biosynthesis